MPRWLPWALLVLLVLLVAAMPWRRPHPNHQFMLEQWSRLREDLPEEPPDKHSRRVPDGEHVAAAGHHHGAGSAHL